MAKKYLAEVLHAEEYGDDGHDDGQDGEVHPLAPPDGHQQLDNRGSGEAEQGDTAQQHCRDGRPVAQNEQHLQIHQGQPDQQGTDGTCPDGILFFAGFLPGRLFHGCLLPDEIGSEMGELSCLHYSTICRKIQKKWKNM